MIKEAIEKIIKAQNKKKAKLIGQIYYPVDISLTNGNILLRAFRIINFENGIVKGITWKEEYCAPRENRPEVYSYFKLEEIASLDCFDLGIEYERETSKS